MDRVQRWAMGMLKARAATTAISIGLLGLTSCASSADTTAASIETVSHFTTNEDSVAPVEAPSPLTQEEEPGPGFRFNEDPYGQGAIELSTEADVVEQATDQLSAAGLGVTYFSPSVLGQTFRFLLSPPSVFFVGKDFTIIEGYYTGGPSQWGYEAPLESPETIEDFQCNLQHTESATASICVSADSLLMIYVPAADDADRQLIAIRDQLFAGRVRLGTEGTVKPAVIAASAEYAVAATGSLNANPLGSAADQFETIGEVAAQIGIAAANVGVKVIAYDPGKLGEFDYYLSSSQLAATSDSLLVIEGRGSIDKDFAARWIDEVNSKSSQTAVSAELVEFAADPSIACVYFRGATRSGVSCGVSGTEVDIVSSNRPEASALLELLRQLLETPIRL